MTSLTIYQLIDLYHEHGTRRGDGEPLSGAPGSAIDATAAGNLIVLSPSAEHAHAVRLLFGRKGCRCTTRPLMTDIGEARFRTDVLTGRRRV